jgi:hypothetical protein
VVHRVAGARSRRLGLRAAALAVATATAASCGSPLGPMTPAMAGGIPGRVCPGTDRVDIADSHGLPVAPAHVGAGFYAQTGLYWPPTTVVACRVSADVRHPLLRVGHDGCDLGGIPFEIPDDATTAGSTGMPESTPRWGTFLPPGWYYLGGAAPTGWTEVCWYLKKPSEE